MEIGQSLEDLASIELGLFLAESGLLPEVVVELASLFELHGEEDVDGTGEAVLHVDHEGVLHLLHDLLFVLEVVEEVPLDDVELANDLECEKLLVVFFLDEEDPPEVALPETAQELEVILVDGLPVGGHDDLGVLDVVLEVLLLVFPERLELLAVHDLGLDRGIPVLLLALLLGILVEVDVLDEVEVEGVFSLVVFYFGQDLDKIVFFL